MALKIAKVSRVSPKRIGKRKMNFFRGLGVTLAVTSGSADSWCERASKWKVRDYSPLFEAKRKRKRDCVLRVYGKTRGWNSIESDKTRGRRARRVRNGLARMVRWASGRRMLKPSGGMSAVDVACRHRMLFNSAFITRKTTWRFAIAAGGRVSLRAGFSRTALRRHRFNIRYWWTDYIVIAL